MCVRVYMSFEKGNYSLNVGNTVKNHLLWLLAPHTYNGNCSRLDSTVST